MPDDECQEEIKQSKEREGRVMRESFSPRKRYLSCLMRGRERCGIWEKRVPGRGRCKCEGSRGTAGWACLRNSKGPLR